MLNFIIIKLIKLYQFLLSPDHSFWARALGKSHCRYYPTCSNYGKECFEKFGFFRATRLTVWRILRCHPWSKGGLDPVPDIEQGKCNHKHSKK
ncbi:membrane protein insertion efficiency factor YidD [Candidatus Gracilibacteria bacterium]|nr:membrane protein insertion efficiency factor YidD [Candidatus Gracilibacteria bacterium]